MNAVTSISTDDRSTLARLIGEFESRESHDNDDVVVNLNNVRATPSATLIVPGLHGEFAVTDHARNQLGRLLGLRWERFFQNATPHDRAEELNRRLTRAQDVVKVRSANGTDVETDAVVKAIVSPTYTPIADTVVATAIRGALANVEPEARLIRADVTDRTTSYVVKLGESFHAGGPGEVGEVWGALAVRNSGVGFTRLSVTLHLTRVCCLNGMVAPVPDSSIIRSVHRNLDLGRVRAKLAQGLQDVRGRLHRGVGVLEDAGHHEVGDAEGEVRALLRAARLPLGLVSDVLDGFRREPHQSRFGIVQAITWAAQRTSPEVRFEMERAAGQYLARGA